MRLRTENIHEYRLKCNTVAQITLDDDFNVPDTKDDIELIVKEWGNVQTDSVKVNKDKATVDGELKFSLLYIGASSDSERMQPVKMTGKMSFSENVNLSGDCTGDYVTCQASIEDLSIKAINSRKISVKAIVTLKLICESLQDIQMITGVEETENTDIQQLKEELEFASAAVASSSEEGAEFMSLIYPDTYQNASGLELANTLKRLFSYTTSNALYNDFDTSYNNFFTGKAAMVPNGYWMIDQIPDGWEQCVRFSSFPGNTLVSSPETFGWALTSGCSEEVKEGALAFFKFRTEFNLLEKETMFSMEEKYISQVERDYLKAFSNSPTFVPNYQVKWNSVFQENTLSKYLPQLAEGRITPEDFLNYADDSIRQFEEEQ